MRAQKYCNICKKRVPKQWFNDHTVICNNIKNNIINNLECKYCGDTHCGTYGSGFFCSSECARGFSTFFKREEINTKVSLSLKGKGKGENNKSIHYKERLCKFCKELFIINSVRHKNKIYCSRDCVFKCPLIREKQSEAASNRVLKHKQHPFGYNLTFNDGRFNIKCDSALEWCCIKYFVDGYEIQSIDRCDFSIPYLQDNINKRYVPDFIAKTNNGEVLLIECKCDRTTTNTDTLIWKRYYSTAPAKQKALQDYCVDNGYIPCWFTQKVDTVAYRNFLKNVE